MLVTREAPCRSITFWPAKRLSANYRRGVPRRGCPAQARTRKYSAGQSRIISADKKLWLARNRAAGIFPPFFHTVRRPARLPVMLHASAAIPMAGASGSGTMASSFFTVWILIHFIFPFRQSISSIPSKAIPLKRLKSQIKLCGLRLYFFAQTAYNSWLKAKAQR